MHTCACCGRLTPLKNIKCVDLYSQVEASKVIYQETTILNRMLARLKYMHGVPHGVRKHYDLSEWYGLRFQILSTIPLDHRGVAFNGKGCNVSLYICTECVTSLKGSNAKPPWASYANNWATGVMPKEFHGLSVAETKMIRLGTLSFSSLCIAGQSNGVLSSHIVTRMGHRSASEILPRNLDDSDVKVIFSNASMTDQELISRKWARVRKMLVCEVTRWLRKNSVAYPDDIKINVEIPDDETVEKMISSENDNGELLKQVWATGDRVGGGDAVYESCVMHVDISNDVMLSLTKPNKKNMVENLKRFLIRNKPDFANNRDKTYFGGIFPLRFPYGIGTPNCNRPVRVSLVKAYQRYLLLGDRSFGQDYEFLMHAFDQLARMKLHTSIYVQLNQHPKLSDDAVTLTTSDIEKALEITAQRRYQAKRGHIDEDTKTDGINKAIKILGVIQKGASHAPCTDEERMKMSRFSDSVSDRKGKAHGMVTFTPKDNVSGWIAVFSGHLDGVKYEDIREWDNPNFPSQANIRKAACKDPTLAAISFQKYVDEYVIPIYFGWDMENGCSFPGGGQIGTLEAFIIPVESQGGLTSTLHGHALVWFKNLAKTSQKEEEDDKYNTRLCEIADQLLVGSFPILELFKDKGQNGQLKCPCCINGNIDNVEIPYVCKTSLATNRPIVAQCTTCGAAFTSHSLRMEFIKILTKLVNSYDGDLSLEQLYMDVKNIMSADCLFPFPEPLPKYLDEDDKKQYIVKLKEMLVYESSNKKAPIPAFSARDAEYIMDVIRLDIGIEITHEHRATVSTCILSS